MQKESEVFQRALEQVREGNGLRAEALVVDAVRRVEAEQGRQSSAFSQAQWDLARILIAVGDLARSADALRAAAEFEGTNDDEKKDRLTYLMNLGEVLVKAGALEEAERVLRDGLQEREAFYGSSHAGYAFGLEPLAEVLWRQGNTEDALELVEEATEILWNHGNPQVASALALRAFVRKDADDEADAFSEMEELPPPLFEALLEACLTRAEEADPSVSLAVLRELRETLSARSVEPAGQVPVVIALSNVARAAQAWPECLEALEWLAETFDALGDLPNVVEATLGLALARDQAGDEAGGEQSYLEAAQLAEKLGDAAVRSQVARNHGLFLSQRGHEDEASAQLDQAVEWAEAGGDSEMRGRALVARGIFRQEHGRAEQGGADLRRSLELLPPTHADALMARSHLQALEKGHAHAHPHEREPCGCGDASARACGCGDMSQAVSEALKVMVLPQAPAGLLADIGATMDEAGEVKLDVRLAREPTQEELERLDRVIRQALAQLRNNLKTTGYV